MTNEEIKMQCEQLYEIIKNAEDRLASLRKYCKHEETFKGTYSWRPGAMETAMICSFCHTPVYFPERQFPVKTTSTSY